MKKLIFTLLSVFLLGAMGISAETITLDLTAQGYANQQEMTTVPVTGNLSGFTFSKATGQNPPKYYTSGTSVRMYTGNTLAIVAANDFSITSIKFTTGSKSYNITADSGNVTQGANASWSGNANSVMFTVNGKQFHIKSVEITIEASGVTPPPVNKVATPEVTPVSGTYTYGQEVKITCATPDAKISYIVKTSDGVETKQDYTAPFQLTTDCTLSVTAEKEGWQSSETVTRDYKVQKANPLKASFNFATPETLQPSVDRNNILSGSGYNVTEPFTNNGIQVKFTNGSTPTRLWDSSAPHLRVYQNATITISCIEKEISIDKITITGNSNTNESFLVPNVGTYTTDTWAMEWDPTLPEATKHAFTVTFTKQGKTSEITSIEVLKKVATGVDDSEIKVVSIFGTEGGVEISGVEGNVVIYNVYGQQVAGEYVNGNATINTPAGIMIVKAGETVTKVVVK